MKDANNPTRAEFIDLTLELEIDSVIKRQIEGTPLTYEDNLNFLRKIRRQFVTIEFADDEELKESIQKVKESIHKLKEAILKLEAEKKKHSRKGKAGPRLGTARHTMMKHWFEQAWQKYGAKMKYPVYEEFCIEQKADEKDCYPPDTFRKQMRKKIMGL